MSFHRDKQDKSGSAAAADPDSQEPSSPGETGPGFDSEPAQQPARERSRSGNMLPGRERRRFGVERILTRLVATCGVIGIGVVIAAIMVSNHSQGWIVGLVVACVSVILSGILWSSRQL